MLQTFIYTLNKNSASNIVSNARYFILEENYKLLYFQGPNREFKISCIVELIIDVQRI